MTFELMHGDCREVLRNVPDESIDLVVTDPPYRVTKRGGHGNAGGMLTKDIFKRGEVFAHNSIEPNEYLPELFRVLKQNTHCYVMTNHVNLVQIITEARSCGFHFIKSLIWDKGNKIMGQAYMSQFEYILFFRKGAFKKINHCGTSELIHIPNKKTKGADGKNLHDTEKPVALMELLIENSSQVGDLVLDPFTGVGSTGIACMRKGRNFLGTELDDKYFEIARKRISHEVQIGWK